MKATRVLLAFFALITLAIATARAEDTLRVFTWYGYVTPEDVTAVNELLKAQGYDIKAEVITPLAESSDQMFEVLQAGKADVSFLTLNFIMMQEGRIAKLLQPIRTGSPRLSNLRYVNPSLALLPMGSTNFDPLYIPFGGGTYGIWANLAFYKPSELPKSINELVVNPKWKGKLSLTRGQVSPNIALASLCLNKNPFMLNDLVKAGQLDDARHYLGELLPKLRALHAQVGTFWDVSPTFKDDQLTACYGIEIPAENAKGGKWTRIHFQEGATVWLDTINFHRRLSGRKLEAAEIFANYFIGKQVQERIVNELNMVGVSSLVKPNPQLDEDPNFFDSKMLLPPYDTAAYDAMKKLFAAAMNTPW